MNPLLDQRQAAHLLRLSVRTLERHRVAGTGPRFIRLGRRLIRYRVSDLAEWVDGGLRNSTSETSPRGPDWNRSNPAND
jgi:predicted DNA-binding transcriptional regulator AlpA